MMKSKHLQNINECENAFLDLFCTQFVFSKNLIKYVDPKIFDMYDHNFFKHNRYTTLKEVNEAYKYQYDNYFDYLKFISSEKLKKKVIEETKLEEVITLTMLYDEKNHKFEINDKVLIKDISLEDLNKIEIKHYAKIYGKDFLLRRNQEFINLAKTNPNFKLYGAYINNKIVGECYSFTHNDYTCLDSLLVDNRYRHKRVATTLIKHIIDNYQHVYLHADQDDTPKIMYQSLGFKIIDKSYEYYKDVNIKEDYV